MHPPRNENNSTKVTHKQRPIDSIDFRILDFFKGEFTVIKPLIGSVATASVLYRHAKRLCAEGRLESDKKGGYRTTEQGLLALKESLGEVPEGLASVYEPLARVPVYHAALIELAVLATIAKKNNLRSDKFPFFVIIGDTLAWKTSAGRFLTHMLDVDPATHIINSGSEEGKSLWMRKTSRGEISTKRELIESPIAIFDEFQDTTPETRRLIKLWLSDTKTVPFENIKVTIEATTVLIMNPKKGVTLEERSGLSRPEIRRAFILDTTKIKLPDLALIGEDIVAAAKAHGPLELPKPKSDCTRFRLEVHEFLARTLLDAARKIVDSEVLLMLSTALTSFLEPEKAVKRVLFDALLLYESLGWTSSDWKMQMNNFPRPIPRVPEMANPDPSEAVSNDMRRKAFRLLENGGNPTDLVTELGYSMEEAEKVSSGYYNLKRLGDDNKVTGTTEKKESESDKIQREIEILELQRKKRELEAPFEYEKNLARAIAPAEDIGRWKQEECVHMRDKYCRFWIYGEKPTDSFQVDDPIHEAESWFIRPSFTYCADCPGFQQRNKASITDLEQRLRNAETEVRRLVKITVNIVAFSNNIGKERRRTCSNFDGEYCLMWWTGVPDKAFFIGEPFRDDDKCYIAPTPSCCAHCSSYSNKDASQHTLLVQDCRALQLDG